MACTLIERKELLENFLADAKSRNANLQYNYNYNNYNYILNILFLQLANVLCCLLLQYSWCTTSAATLNCCKSCCPHWCVSYSYALTSLLHDEQHTMASLNSRSTRSGAGLSSLGWMSVVIYSTTRPQVYTPLTRLALDSLATRTQLPIRSWPHIPQPNIPKQLTSLTPATARAIIEICVTRLPNTAVCGPFNVGQ